MFRKNDFDDRANWLPGMMATTFRGLMNFTWLSYYLLRTVFTVSTSVILVFWYWRKACYRFAPSAKEWSRLITFDWTMLFLMQTRPLCNNSKAIALNECLILHVLPIWSPCFRFLSMSEQRLAARPCEIENEWLAQVKSFLSEVLAKSEGKLSNNGFGPFKHISEQTTRHPRTSISILRARLDGQSDCFESSSLWPRPYVTNIFPKLENYLSVGISRWLDFVFRRRQIVDGDLIAKHCKFFDFESEDITKTWLL